MPEETIEDRVKAIVIEQLGVDPASVVPTASFTKDLGADSLDVVELMMAMEEEFGVNVSDEEAEKLVTVGDAVKFIEVHQ